MAGGALVDLDHGAAVEAVILGGVAEAADASFGEAEDLRAGVVVAVASGVVHEEFFAVDEAELVAVAWGEDFIEGDMVVDGAGFGGGLDGGLGAIGADFAEGESASCVLAHVTGILQIARTGVGLYVRAECALYSSAVFVRDDDGGEGGAGGVEGFAGFDEGVIVLD